MSWRLRNLRKRAKPEGGVPRNTPIAESSLIDDAPAPSSIRVNPTIPASIPSDNGPMAKRASLSAAEIKSYVISSDDSLNATMDNMTTNAAQVPEARKKLDLK